MKKYIKNCIAALAIVCSLTAQAQDESSLLWKIEGNGLEKPSYIFGTIHMICQEDYIMTDKIQNTLKNVDAYYAEINFSDANNMAIMQKSMMSEIPLSKRLSAEKYNELKTLLSDVVNLDIKQFENFSDAAIVSMITFKGFPCAEFKMYEMELLQSVMHEKKKLGGLETVEEQMRIMNNSLGIDAIFQMLKDIKTEGFESTRMMVELYKNQNIQGLYEYMKKASYMNNEVYNEILLKRNHNWLKEMPKIMKSTSTFFAVGAAHLGGENGVINLLQQKGYKVTPVNIH